MLARGVAKVLLTTVVIVTRLCDVRRYNWVTQDDDLDEYTASSGGAAAAAAGSGAAEARRVRQRAGGRDAPSDVFGEAADVAAGASQRLGIARQVDQLAAAQEMPPPRARRAAATLANVRLGENLYVERGGERQDQRPHEAASRVRAAATAARAAPEVMVIEGIAITAHVSRAAAAAGPPRPLRPGQARRVARWSAGSSPAASQR